MTRELSDPSYVTLRSLAAIFNLPIAWLRREADEGRLPCLRAGRRRLFNIEEVRRALAERAVPAIGSPAEARP